MLLERLYARVVQAPGFPHALAPTSGGEDPEFAGYIRRLVDEEKPSSQACYGH